MFPIKTENERFSIIEKINFFDNVKKNVCVCFVYRKLTFLFRNTKNLSDLWLLLIITMFWEGKKIYIFFVLNVVRKVYFVKHKDCSIENRKLIFSSRKKQFFSI